MISVHDLRKAYGDHQVLDGISFAVAPGTVFALLGPNGSGKTTTVNILSTLLPADGGTITVGGHDLRADPDGVRQTIGVTGQFSAVDNLLTGRENLRLMADLLHVGRKAAKQRAQQLLEQFDLTEAADKPAATYSGGMKRRLDLAMTLVGEPRLIFLDEPTTGLDPRSRRAMWQAIHTLVDSGTTILLTTQYLDEADRLADRIAVLDHGRIVTEGTPEELKRSIHGGHVLLTFPDLRSLRAARRVLNQDGDGEDALTLRVPLDGTVPTLRALITELDEHDIALADLSIHTPDLDDVFFAVTEGQT
jgi:ABC-2 type transport system ATP-binding protein